MRDQPQADRLETTLRGAGFETIASRSLKPAAAGSASLARRVARKTGWYDRDMSGTSAMRVGDRGRLVLPADLRQRRNWTEGTTLVAIESEHGVVLTERDELEKLVRDQLAGKDVVKELIEERRRAAATEDQS
ncbi:AbrB/MazE/SpoVT family DNA-binding domain-containing protein [Cryobacterium sp. BB307]|uniref:AbrB/MazE/SpoVT family DNA-binding domain-containing protein n=1 Tax=Cryobacterium sp. BB307 TaxID=2716317 RepID=UPI001B2FF695|nr:AbrB/MazE/SpoVT family DNA-binding domain-containing protein [Cryobacterium sp. BB307]